ncbi:MAG: hypothetical protein Hyperionvirus14_12 [Hyperionvirus sp.]|uniref:Uncharacterized protein n=1 Tax=Hyperionvirus sp. TaxID=2487770 RepID=A0A3G5ADF4_9VIRU|nr:MAG: hypothetical protein Hyperionvirus14_12 [Hyperionvirus sp.]
MSSLKLVAMLIGRGFRPLQPVYSMECVTCKKRTIDSYIKNSECQFSIPEGSDHIYECECSSDRNLEEIYKIFVAICSPNVEAGRYHSVVVPLLKDPGVDVNNIGLITLFGNIIFDNHMNKPGQKLPGTDVFLQLEKELAEFELVLKETILSSGVIWDLGRCVFEYSLYETRVLHGILKQIYFDIEYVLPFWGTLPSRTISFKKLK